MSVFSKIAFRNVRKNWRHSLAATISLSAGFISLVLFQGYIIDVENMYQVGFRNRAMYGDLLVENPALQDKEGRAEPEKYFITVEDQAKIESYLQAHRDQVETRVRFLPATGMVSNGKNTYIFLAMGYDVPEGAVMRGDVWRWDALYGQPLHVGQDPNGVMLGKSLGFLLNCLPEKNSTRLVQNGGYDAKVRPFQCERPRVQLTATTETGQVNALDLNVSGLIDGGYKDVDEKWMKLSIDNVQTLLNTKKIRFLSILLKDRSQVFEFRDGFNQFFQKENIPLKAQRWLEHPVGQLFQQTMSLLNIFKIFIVIVIMTISGLSVFNTMVKIVKERTKEIGTMRSLGYTGHQVSFIFTFEAFYLSLFGILIGLAVSVIFTFAMNHSGLVYKAGMLSEPVLFQIAVDPKTYLQSFLLLTILSVVTSWIATRHIIRSRVSENLTYA
jgi:putative ABC transport system permease protein